MNHFYRFLFAAGLSCSFYPLQAQTTAFAQVPAKPAAAPKPDQVRYFPFTVDEGALTVKVNIREARVAQYYTPLFQKYQYAGNVRTWEGMVEELLADKDLDFSVRNKIDSDTDDDVVTFTATSKQELEYFLNLVQPTFSVISRLESFVKRVDPKQINDGSHTVEDYR